MSELAINDYTELLEDLKQRVRQAQIKAALSINREIIFLYWQIGCEILQRQKAQGWGAKVIEQLARDLKNTFPEVRGFSSRNLKYMRLLAESYPEEEFVQQRVAQIPWGHNTLILDKVKGDARKWYINKTIENGWSRNILALQIESGLIHRQGKAVTNFSQTLPIPQGDIARELLKDPYNFTFLTFEEETLERDLERGLLANLKKFLLELGIGFAFVGSQYHLEVGGEDFYLDLLFYHLRLRCFVVIDLKITEFKPEYAGKMNFYLSAVDDLLRHDTDAPSIGLILCRDKNRVIAEYTLRDNNKPIGVSEYRVTKALPNELQDVFPTVEQLEAKLAVITINEPDT